MRVVTAAEMKALDRATIERGTPGLALMDRAGRGVAEVVARHLDRAGSPGRAVAVVAGSGHNAGDGFIAARHLAERGARVTVLIAGRRDRLAPDARASLEAAERVGVPVVDVSSSDAFRAAEACLGAADVVIDALLGTGLDRELGEPLRALIGAMNRSRGLRVAVDIPSGLHADTGEPLGAVFDADVTVTFAFPKVALVMHPGFQHAGRVEVVDIGITDALAEEHGVRLWLIDEALTRGVLPRRAPSAHKGSFGHVLVVAGSEGKTGAALLAGDAAMRAGAGLCTIASTAAGQRALAARVLEPMTERYADSEEPAAEDLARLLALVGDKKAVVAGPGIPTGGAMADLVAGLVRACPVPVVFDASALNLLVGRTGVLRQARAPVALTPHPGEMARLVGRNVAEVQADRIGVARRLAAETGAYVALKGARTVVAAPDGRAWINPSGNPGMATGGTGDVLTGVVGAFLAQGVPLPEALCAAVHVHGLAGDRAAERRGRMGLIARDLLDEVSGVLRDWGR